MLRRGQKKLKPKNPHVVSSVDVGAVMGETGDLLGGSLGDALGDVVGAIVGALGIECVMLNEPVTGVFTLAKNMT